MKKPAHFEEAFARLEEIARLLEAGEVSLEESVKLFEEGMSLIEFCSDKLNKAEGKIRQLSRDPQGKLALSDQQPAADEDAQ